jgi:hypothetical protein
MLHDMLHCIRRALQNWAAHVLTVGTRGREHAAPTGDSSDVKPRGQLRSLICTFSFKSPHSFSKSFRKSLKKFGIMIVSSENFLNDLHL